MAELPYSRVVNVTVDRRDAFPARRGFGVPLFLTSTAKTGKLTAAIRTRAYGSIDEVAADWTSSEPFYQAALAAFSQQPRPIQVKAGWYDATGIDAAKLSAQLDLIKEYDNGWYWIDVEATLRDTATLDGLVSWAEANNKLNVITSNAAGTESSTDTATLAARNKGKYERTAVFYSATPAEYPGFALAAKCGTFTFDDADSGYTAKFKDLAGITPLGKGSAVVQAVTGFVPQLGQSLAAGHMANAYVNIGGRNFTVEGSTLTPNVFIDEIHATDWIVARTEEELLGIFLNNPKVPFDDDGMQTLASAARTVMRLATRAGLVARDLDANGDYSPAVVIDVPSVFDVPEAQRKARIAPAIKVTFRYSGAVHYSTINYVMTF
ncbi:DUF3383 family protein [Aureimonas ureilytica]|uniref:DUF3383 family protein n=1 Tax=Aureimonas ureilytica TaxID=401562 RepID=UPI000362236E|nr:DUF3383 family protein [Aureimonas ureilytica]